METGKPELDAYWTQWLRESMKMGVDLVELLEKLRKQGFTDKAIAAGFDAVRPKNDCTEESFSPPLLRRNPPGLRRFDDPRVELYVYDGFLSRRECERLVGLIDHHLRPSTVSFDNGDKGFRTSQTSHLSHLRSPVALGIDEKICKTLGIRADYSEGIQAQRYDVGQQFDWHYDGAFERATGERSRLTFMIYLNDDFLGGQTSFESAVVVPQTGLALFFVHQILHKGQPVHRGRKYVLRTDVMYQRQS